VRIVCISDTHNCSGQFDVPEGDILVHAGDATINGTIEEICNFNSWFSALPHPHKVLIAGNHDWLFERDNAAARSLLSDNITYLQDSSAEIAGLKFFGSPWQPVFYQWAFNLPRGSEMAQKWAHIPDDIDILITHGPPNGILDQVPRSPSGSSPEGCEELRKRIEHITSKGKLKLHIFGHIHCGYGIQEEMGVKFINACTCDESYLPTNPPIVIDI
jgi:Icc-related predicted phosphoesterase